VTERQHLGLYGEVNANLLDGSSIWLQSLALTLASIPGSRITVLLRAPAERDLVLGPLRDHPGIRLVEPTPWSSGPLLAAAEAAAALAEIDDEDAFDVLIVRGADATEAAALSGRFDGRLWPYHVPRGASGLPAATLAAAGRVLCQTEAIRDSIAPEDPELAARSLILPPMIPELDPELRRHDGPVRRLFYAGKLSPEYCGLEMVELIGRLRDRLPEVEIHVAGDKVHNPPDDPEFRDTVIRALRETPGIVWHGGVARERVAELMREADIALSLRHPSLDASPEMSTKVLEYGARGCPVVLNPTAAHERLLGSDYPLFATTVDEAVEAVVAASADPDIRRLGAARVRANAEAHTFEKVALSLEPHVCEARRIVPGPSGRPRILVSGHNFGFASELAERASANGAVLRWDPWDGHAEDREDLATAELEWADVVLCEWCLGNAVWHSRNKLPGRRLVIRFHRMELETPYPGQLDLDAVDELVFVASHVLEAACERFGWDPGDPRLKIVPNAVDAVALRRPKLPDTQFTLGLIGYVPWIKRLDRALDILELLRVQDDRYRLVVKGRGPWEYPWMISRDLERRRYEQTFARIERSPSLRRAVAFEPYGEDIPEFLQDVGWILSTSEIEGHSVALAEGMTAGSVPVIIDRPGARNQYEPQWVHDSPEDAAVAIAGATMHNTFARQAESARRFASRWSWERIGLVWDQLLGQALR
jgi:glycosyltransferase involved in cell wall biosynthesis